MRDTLVINHPLTPEEDRFLLQQMRLTVEVSRALRPDLIRRAKQEVSQPTKE